MQVILYTEYSDFCLFALITEARIKYLKAFLCLKERTFLRKEILKRYPVEHRQITCLAVQLESVFWHWGAVGVLQTKLLKTFHI